MELAINSFLCSSLVVLRLVRRGDILLQPFMRRIGICGFPYRRWLEYVSNLEKYHLRPGISIVVVSFDSGPVLEECVSKLGQAFAGEILVVENGADEGKTKEILQTWPDIRLLHSEANLGFAGGANLGIRNTSGDPIVILNPDVLISNESLEALGRAFKSDGRVGVAGCKLLYPDGVTLQHAGGTLSYPLALADHFGYGENDHGQFDASREVEYVTGAAFAIRRSVFEKLGGFDEGYFPVYFEEADLCYRARQAGFKVLYVPQAVAIHVESATIGKNTPDYYHFYHRNRLRFVLKHYSDAQLGQDFLPAELERLRQVDSMVELESLQKAYADNLKVLAGRADFLANETAATPLAKTDERLSVLKRLGGYVTGLIASRGKETTDLQNRVLELSRKSQVTEVPFASNTPVVGPLIVWIRELWNRISTKWYVQPILAKQNEFNAEVVASVRDLTLVSKELELHLHAAESSAFDADRSAVNLNRELALLEARFRRLEENLAAIQRALASQEEGSGTRS